MRKRKDKRRGFRPGGGQYAAHTGPFSAVSDLRERFMSAAFAITELEESFKALYETHLRGNPDWLVVGNMGTPGEKSVNLAHALLKPWSERWGLADDWCLKWILTQKLLPLWAHERGQVGVATTFWFGPQSLKRLSFRVDFDGWDVTEKIRTDFEAELRKRFEAELRKYCDERESEAKAAGYVKTRERRNPDHLAWLACYQVCRFSPREMAKALGVRLYAVQYAISGLTEEIGLTKNPASYRPASQKHYSQEDQELYQIAFLLYLVSKSRVILVRH